MLLVQLQSTFIQEDLEIAKRHIVFGPSTRQGQG